MKFKNFLAETNDEKINQETLDKINAILSDMDKEEISDFGAVLYDEFFDDDYEDPENGSQDAAGDAGSNDDNSNNSGENSEEEYEFDLEDVTVMIDQLGPNSLDDVLDLLEEDDDDDDDDLDEAVSRRLKVGNTNRKKRKFMKKSKAQARRDKPKQKRLARQNKSSKKRYYRANKKKIQSYQKSRSASIKKGKHKVKIRRG